MYEPKDKNRRVRETEVAMHDGQVAPRLQAAAKGGYRSLEIGEADQVFAVHRTACPQITMAQHSHAKYSVVIGYRLCIRRTAQLETDVWIVLLKQLFAAVCDAARINVDTDNFGLRKIAPQGKYLFPGGAAKG